MLNPETRRLWEFLKKRKALSGFVLVGGTALAMHLEHRISEDLDFMIPEPRLPRARIQALKRDGAAHGFTFAPNDRIQDVEEFVDSGMDLHDYQQNFVVGGVGGQAHLHPQSTTCSGSPLDWACGRRCPRRCAAGACSRRSRRPA